MLLRILFLVLLTLLIVCFLRKLVNHLKKSKNKNTSGISNAEASRSILVKCKKCGARIPMEEANIKEKNIFFCKEHHEEQA